MENKNVVVTPSQLFSLAQCSQRMTDYVTPDDALLISCIRCTDGTLIHLYLDKHCVCSREPP